MRQELKEWLEWALWYASKGLPVFPLEPRLKAPIPKSGGHRDATTDEAQIRQWAEMFEAFGQDTPNLAIAPPPGLIVVDVDPEHGGDKTVKELEAQGQQLTGTLVQQSGSGGFHALYAVPPDAQRQPKEPWKGINIKGNGRGYIVVHPSVHPNGRQYQWLNPNAVIEPAPEFVTAVCRGGADRKTEPSPLLQSPRKLPDEAVSQVAEILANELVDGSKHSTVVAFGQWCLARGLAASDAYAIVDEALHQTSGVTDHEAGCQASLWGYQQGVGGGYTALSELLASGRQGLEVLTYCVKRYTGPTVEESIAGQVTAVAERVLGQSLEAVPPTPENPWGRFQTLRPTDAVEPREELVEGLDIAKGYSTGIVGLMRSGKTPLSMLLACCVAHGVPFLGHETKQAKVILAVSEKVTSARRTLRQVAKGLSVDPDAITVVNLSRDKLNLEDALGEFLHGLQHSGAEMLVLDTYNDAVEGLDRNQAEFSAPMKKVAAACDDFRCAFVPVLHTKKSSVGLPSLVDIDGHNSAGATLSAAWGVHQPDPDKRSRFRVGSTRASGDEFEPFEFELRTESETLGDELEPALIVSRAEFEELSQPDKPSKKPESSAERAGRWVDEARQIILNAGKQVSQVELLGQLQPPGRGLDKAKRDALREAVPDYLAAVDQFGFEYRRGGNGAKFYKLADVVQAAELDIRSVVLDRHGRFRPDTVTASREPLDD